MKFKNLKIGQRIFISTIITILLFTGVAIFQLYNIENLSELQSQDKKRNKDAIWIAEHSAIGQEMYQIIADAIINRNEHHKNDWGKKKRKIEKQFINFDKIVDTELERNLLEDVKIIYFELDLHVSQELFPLLKKEYNDSIKTKINSLDAEIDKQITDIQSKLLKILISIKKESVDSGKIYNETISSTFNWSIIIIIMTIIISLSFSLSIRSSIRKILQSLIKETSNLTQAAVDGNLKTRIEEEKINFEFRNIAKGLNKTLDAVIKPLHVAANTISRIAIGDIPENIINNYNGDFNLIKNNLNILINSNKEIIEKAKQVAKGDLMVKLEKRSENDELMISLFNMVDSISKVINEVNFASESVATGSAQISSSSEAIAQGAGEQAASVEEISSSMEEMVANIQQNTENAQQTEKIATEAAESIKDGSSSVIKTVNAMKEIASKISIIGEIARKTDLLAINAAVEAARAGEHGRGFAVVASEVRKLAERSQKAAEEIDKLSSESVSIAEHSGKLFNNIVPNIQKTSFLVQEISSASQEQTASVEQINNAIQQLSQVTQSNSAASEETSSSSEKLANQAVQLKDIISFFKIKNEKKIKLFNKELINYHKNEIQKDKGLKLNLDEKDNEYEIF